MLRTLLFLCIAVLPACTSELEIYQDGSDEPIKGVPFRGSEVWVAEGLLTKHSKEGSQCAQAPFQDYVSLASGTLYSAQPDPGWLANSEFSIMFNENGSVKQIQLNSESNFAENVSAVSELAGTVLPFVTAPKAAPETLRPGQLPACDVGKNVQSSVRLDKWTADTWKPPNCRIGPPSHRRRQYCQPYEGGS